ETTLGAEAVEMVELPLRMSNLRPHGAAWVEAAGGLVVPAVAGVGLNMRREALETVLEPDGASTRTTRTIVDVVERDHPFWVFRGEALEFPIPVFDVHPQIGMPWTMHQLGDG